MGVCDTKLESSLVGNGHWDHGRTALGSRGGECSSTSAAAALAAGSLPALPGPEAGASVASITTGNSSSPSLQLRGSRLWVRMRLRARLYDSALRRAWCPTNWQSEGGTVRFCGVLQMIPPCRRCVVLRNRVSGYPEQTAPGRTGDRLYYSPGLSCAVPSCNSRTGAGEDQTMQQLGWGETGPGIWHLAPGTWHLAPGPWHADPALAKTQSLSNPAHPRPSGPGSGRRQESGAHGAEGRTGQDRTGHRTVGLRVGVGIGIGTGHRHRAPSSTLERARPSPPPPPLPLDRAESSPRTGRYSDEQ
ncbi:unnamed protein product [Diplocarpon coronariae]